VLLSTHPVTHHSSQELPDSDASQDDLSDGDAPGADEVRVVCASNHSSLLTVCRIC
jgi:hypothetical protein